jgi:hypothetical protein
MSTQRKILKSWKEIASYLGVGTRTAQRWTRQRGLPVRRPGIAHRTAVLGFSDDIDRWLRSSGGQMREPLEGIVTTDLLATRPTRPRQLEREIDALLEIGCEIARARSDILRRIATIAMMLCKAESAGFSILETDKHTPDVFRWVGTCGVMEQFAGGTTPSSFSPCGVCLERNSPQLFHYPERFYPYLQPIAPVAELLLIPMHDGIDWVGTIWIISHSGRRKFDSEDARLMHNLGVLACAALAASTPSSRAPARKSPKRRTPERA